MKFLFISDTIQNTLAITLSGMTGSINWGDNNNTNVVAAKTTYEKEYPEGRYIIEITGDVENLTEFSCKNTNISGALFMLAGCERLEKLEIREGIHGQPMDLVKMVDLENIVIASESIQGDFISFKQYEADSKFYGLAIIKGEWNVI